MSQTLILGEEMKNDFEKKSELTLPFVYALEKSIDSFCDMVANGQSHQLWKAFHNLMLCKVNSYAKLVPNST